MGLDGKSSRKRTAPYDGTTPKAKKPHIDKRSGEGKSKESKKTPATSEHKVQQKSRSRPVTLPIKPDEDSELESDPGDEFEGMDEGEDGDVADDVAEMQLDDKPPKDPNAARESHKLQKEVTAQRRAAKPHSDLITSAKRTWALARQQNLPPAERKVHIRALMSVIRGNVADVCLKHDASRIVQTVAKYGGQAERDELAVELKGNYVKLAQSRYSKFLVTKLVRYCPAHRAAILAEFQGSVVRLLLHREAAGVLADAFELYANAGERALLLRDFYGKEAALFSVTVGSEADKERARKGLVGMLEGVEGERRKRLMGAVKENLITIFNNSDKGAVTHAIVHRALWEYLSAVNLIEDEAEQEKQRRELFETCQDTLAEMVHTRDGSRAVREFIAQGSAKDRKAILKALKPHVARMCADDEAQLVLFTALDTVDDTKLLSKSVVQLITEAARTSTDAPALLGSPAGRRAVLYLLLPRTPRHFTPATVRSLAETDGARAKTSKKDEAVRREEVRAAASPELLQMVEERGAELARDPGGSLLVGDIMLYSEGDKSAAMGALLSALRVPYPSTDAENPHPVDLPHTSRMYKTLLQGGHFSHATRSIVPAPLWSPGAFAAAFVQTFKDSEEGAHGVVAEDGAVAGKEMVCAMARGDGAFLLAELCERVKAEGGEEERRVVKSWFGKRERKEIEKSEVKGKKVLLEKIEALLEA